jgi:hypothetical protein
MVLLSGRLTNGKQDEGKVYACPNCDVPEKPISEQAMSIIQLSKRNTS